jgi:hypothetical protein
MVGRKKKKITFKEFYLKAGIEDGMAAMVYFHQFCLSGLTLNQWLGKEEVPSGKLKGVKPINTSNKTSDETG